MVLQTPLHFIPGKVCDHVQRMQKEIFENTSKEGTGSFQAGWSIDLSSETGDRYICRRKKGKNVCRRSI